MTEERFRNDIAATPQNSASGASCYTDPTPAYASPVYDVPPPKSSRFAPLGIGGFIGNMLLFAIPLVGWIICLIWACGGCKNENRKNHARAALILGVIVFALSAAAGYLYRSALIGLWGQLLSQLA